VGFHLVKNLKEGKPIGICIKAFTKRKQEYVEDSSFDVLTIQKRLANPLLVLTVLFSFLLNALFPSLFKKVREVTTGMLAAIYLGLFPPTHKYLLSGKLVI
jgi:GTP:adenosylcobinamide-phosphate guanylyltransferase